MIIGCELGLLTMQFLEYFLGKIVPSSLNSLKYGMVVDCLILPMVFIHFCLQILSFDCNITTSVEKVASRSCCSAAKIFRVGKIVNRGIFTTNKSITITHILPKSATIISTYSKLTKCHSSASATSAIPQEPPQF